jgi:hypothetical protein
MSESYATIDDVIALFRPLTTDEEEKTNELLPIVSDELRWRANMVGRDLDQMISDVPVLANVAKEVTVSAVSRILRQDTSGEAMTQYSQSALGYSVSGTYAVPGGGIGNAILPSDLKRLGLKRGRIGVIDFYDPRNGSPT